MADLISGIVFVTGLGLLTIGAYLVYEPAGWIVAGTLLILVVVLFQRGRGAA